MEGEHVDHHQTWPTFCTCASSSSNVCILLRTHTGRSSAPSPTSGVGLDESPTRDHTPSFESSAPNKFSKENSFERGSSLPVAEPRRGTERERERKRERERGGGGSRKSGGRLRTVTHTHTGEGTEERRKALDSDTHTHTHTHTRVHIHTHVNTQERAQKSGGRLWTVNVVMRGGG